MDIFFGKYELTIRIPPSGEYFFDFSRKDNKGTAYSIRFPEKKDRFFGKQEDWYDGPIVDYGLWFITFCKFH